jgi:hypothetical protein
MEKFRWGNMETEGDIYLDENILRMTTNLRLQLSSLAEALIDEGRKDEARNVLDLSLEKMPERNVPFDRILLPTVEAYYATGDTAKADALNERIFEIMEENLTWLLSLEDRFVKPLEQEMAITHAVMGRLETVASPELKARLADRMETMDALIQGREQGGKRTTRMRF